MRIHRTFRTRIGSVGTRIRALGVVAIAALVVAGGVVVPDQTAEAAPEPPPPSCEEHPYPTIDEETGVTTYVDWPSGRGRTCVERHPPGTVSGSGAGVAGGEVTFTLSGKSMCASNSAAGCYGTSNWWLDWRFYIPDGPNGPHVIQTDFHVDSCRETGVLTCTATLPDELPPGASHLIGRVRITNHVSTPPELCQDTDLIEGFPGCYWVSPDGKARRWNPFFSERWILEGALPLVNADPENTRPNSDFTFSLSGNNTFAFTATATDAEDPPEQLSYAWDFDDGETSNERNPEHEFPGPGTYQVTLTVTDTDGKSHSRTYPVAIRETVVNSTGDAPLADSPAGCDTGDMVGDVPECTLHAALQVVANDGGGEITFDIDAGGVPTIAIGEPLPLVTEGTTIDGTSQPGGQVAVDGLGAGTTTLTVTGADTAVKGLVLDNATRGIRLALAEDAVITDNVIGADAAGTTVGSVELGVSVLSSNGVAVSENVIGAEFGVSTDADSEGAQITDNEIGVHKGGGAVLGSTAIGVSLQAPSALARGNTVHGSTAGITLESGATGAEVRANRIGVARASDVVLGAPGPGVLIMAPDAVVAENVISSTYFGPASFGSVTVTGATATNVTIADNVIGDSAVTGGVDASGAQYGVLAKFGPTDVEVSDNVIAGPEFGVHLIEGSGHSVLGNHIGVDANGVAHPVTAAGVAIEGATNSVVGADGRGNTIHTANFGVGYVGSSDGLIVANEVTATEEGASCISVEEDSDNVTVSANTVVGCTQGITIKGVVGASATRNVVQDPTVGLLIEGDSTTASTNIVLGAELQAIDVRAQDVTLEDNLIGTASRTGAIQPFDGEGIRFESGSGTVKNNVVVGSDGDALVVNTSDVVTLRGNRLEQIGQRPIVAPNGPDQPSIDAAIQSTAPDGSTRTTLVVTDLPEGDAGELEVFANDDCDPDGEAHDVLGVIKTKKLDRTTMIVQLIDREVDNFTATYTDSAGSTSELSECEPIADYPDSDGDGSVDPIDDITGGAGDPTRGVVITDDAQILQVSTDPGRLTGLAAVDDPAPGGHAGVDLPYGTLRFSVEGLAPGGTADVTFLVVDGDALQPTSTYWKFGPASPGATASWFDFSYDDDTGLGAQTLDPVDVGDLGLRRPLQISFEDGALGDADGFTDGTVVDPGAIALPNGEPGGGGNGGGGNDPDPTGGGSEAEPVPTPDVLAQPSGSTPEGTSGTLPRTGAPLLAFAATGLALLLVGSGFWRAALALRRRETRWARL